MKNYKQNWRDKKTTFLFYVIWTPFILVPALIDLKWYMIFYISFMFFVIHRMILWLDSLNIKSQYDADIEAYKKDNPDEPEPLKIMILRNLIGYYVLCGTTKGRTFLTYKGLVKYYRG